MSVSVTLTPISLVNTLAHFFGFPTTGLSSLFVELTDDGFLFKVEVTSEELSVISFVHVYQMSACCRLQRSKS